MMKYLGLILSVACIAIAGCSSATGQDAYPVSSVAADDPEMNAAKAEARRTTAEFLTVLAKPPKGTTDIVFKFPLGGWEHIWVNNVKHLGGHLTGRLANTPEQPAYKEGDNVDVPITGISDWAYRDASGFTHGHRTTRVLLRRMDENQAAEIRQSLGWKD